MMLWIQDLFILFIFFNSAFFNSAFFRFLLFTFVSLVLVWYTHGFVLVLANTLVAALLVLAYLFEFLRGFFYLVDFVFVP